MFHHATSAFHQSTIHPLGDTVQLRCVRRREFLHDTMVRTELGQRAGIVLAKIIYSKGFHTLASLGFLEPDILSELGCYFKLVLKQIHHTVVRVFVNESHEIPFSTKGRSFHRTTHIAVHDL